MLCKKHFCASLIILNILSVGFAWSEVGMIQNKYSPSPVAIQWANRGVELANQGDYAAAVEALFEAWKLSPEKTNSFAQNLSSAYNNYGKQLADRGQFDDAMSKLRKAIFFQEDNKIPASNLDLILKRKNLNPNDFKTRLSEAQKLRANGSLDEAVAEYLKAISLAKLASEDAYKAKLELAQVYQVVYTKYASSPVGIARFEKMQTLAQELAKTSTKDTRPYILLGRAYLAAEKLPEAIETFEKALKINSKDKQVLDSLIGAWRSVVEIAPNEPDNLIGLGNALLKGGYYDEANKILQKAKNIDPKNAEVEKILANSKKSEQEAELYRVAERAFEAQTQGKYDEAIDLYQLVLKNLPPKPETSNIYYNLGLAYQAKSKTSEALNAYNQALKFNPANDDAKKAIEKINKQAVAERLKILDKAISLQNNGNIAEAIQVYQEFLAKEPNNAQAHFNLGTAYQEAGKIKEALNEYKTASKLAPSNSEFSAAAVALDKAINSGVLEAAQADDLLKEAVNLQQAGKTSQAISKYQESLKLNPKNAQAHFNLATALHASKKYSEAALEYKQAYAFDPNGYPEANYFVGNLMEAQNKISEAIAYYKRYLEDQPKAQYSDSAAERIKLLDL